MEEEYEYRVKEHREKEKKLRNNPLFREIIRFQNLQKKFKNFGAYDSEPSCIFKEFIANFYNGKEVKVPVTAGQWELFSNMSGVEDVAKKLTGQLEKIMYTRATMKEMVDAMSWFGWNKYFR